MIHQLPAPVALLLILVGATAGSEGTATPLSVASTGMTVRVDPATLAMDVKASGTTSPRILSEPQAASPSIRVIRTLADRVEWLDDARGIEVSAATDGKTVTVEFRTASPRAINWPLIRPAAAGSVYLLPFGMGSYVPADHEVWQQHLASRTPLRMTEGLSFPVVGLLENGSSTTWLFENEFHNSLAFAHTDDRLLSASVTHEFTTAALAIPYRVRVFIGSEDPLAPAHVFREWAAAKGRLVTLDQKTAETTATELLRGAAHLYLWGGSPLSLEDVKDWKGVVASLRRAEAETSHPVRQLLDSMTDAERVSVKAMLGEQLLIRYSKLEFLRALNRVIPEFGKKLAPDAPESTQIQRACRELSVRFPDCLNPVETWGGIVSPAGIAKLKEAGLDRLWLGLPSWQAGLAHPAGIAAARNAGYLIAPYDSYHSIHPPGLADSWETAQFDADLYERGAVISGEGKALAGFRKVGHLLSPLAARPYVERRISRLMEQSPFNSWFVDADAFGEFFDNYSTHFGHTQQQDAEARIDRLRWATDRFGLVVGSEGGISLMAPVVAFAHGMMTPVMSWGDSDMYKERNSPHFLGRYFPPEQPDRFFKQATLKPEYATVYLDPRFRLPLYPMALGDCVVATHQWGFPSRKFCDQWKVVRLTELLYGVPPLEHVSTGTMDAWLSDFAPYYKVFSPLHRTVAGKAVTDFRCLTPDRMVQQTTFDSVARVTVNYGAAAWQDLAPLSAKIDYLKDGRQVRYTVN